MKKNLLLSFICSVFLVGAHATIFTVQVANFQFTPANIPNVVVGDVIKFVWVSGGHTTTCNPATQPGTSLPGGAPVWNSPIDNNNTTFNYTVTVAGSYHYWCNFHQPDMSGTFTATGAVPVTLKEFNVFASSNKKPAISWKTLTEINVDHFSVRTSTDGFKFSEVARVPAAGNSVTEQSYSVTDNNISNNYKYVYYMLAIIDKDGSEKFSEMKLFKNTLSPSKLIALVGPNPVIKGGQLQVQFNAEKDGLLLAKVFDASGKFVMQTRMTAFPGLNNGHMHAGDLPSGAYTIEFNLDGIKETRKILVK